MDRTSPAPDEWGIFRLECRNKDRTTARTAVMPKTLAELVLRVRDRRHADNPLEVADEVRLIAISEFGR